MVVYTYFFIPYSFLYWDNIHQTLPFLPYLRRQRRRRRQRHRPIPESHGKEMPSAATMTWKELSAHASNGARHA